MLLIGKAEQLSALHLSRLMWVAEKIDAIKDTEPFILVATGSYIGEGFDEARLDTLFLAMPIAWKGTLQQYAGRLHQSCANKKDVQIFDYVDLHVKMFEKMYAKRLKGYASIGYKTKAATLPEAPTQIIFNQDSFFPVYLRDIASVSKHLLIVSPFVTKKRMNQMLAHFYAILKKQVQITIITRPADHYKEDRRPPLKTFLHPLKQSAFICFSDPISTKSLPSLTTKSPGAAASIF